MITSRMRKVLGDFWARPGRTLLTLLGLVVGLYGVGAVVVAFTILANDLDENFRRTLPPHIIISARDVTPRAVLAVRKIDGVIALEDRPIVPARVEVGPGRWMPLNLFIVRDFARMEAARFQRFEGSWPPPTGSMLVERSGRFWIREKPGADLRIRLGAGEPIVARMSGFSFDAGQAPSPMDRVIYGYVTPETYRGWTGAPASSRLLLRLDTSRTTAVAAAAQAEQALRSAGAEVRRVEWHEQLEHPHQFQLNSIVAMLAALAVFSFLMCAVLIINLIDSVMVHEQRSIGVMRALGGRRRQIAADYLLGIAGLGLVAGLLSLPMALGTGRAIAGFAAMAVNFDLLTPEGPAWLAIFVVAVAVLIPASVALWRIIGTTRVPVREALSRVEPGQDTRLSDRLAWLMRPLPLLQRIAARSLLRRPRRVLLSASILALGVAFFMTALNVRSSMMETVDSVKRTRPYDIALTFREAYPVDQVRSWLADFPYFRGLESWSVAEADMLGPGGRSLTNPMATFGVPSQSTAFRPDVIAGSWLDPRRPAGVVLTQAVTNEWPDLKVGERYRLRRGARTVPVEVIGIIKDFGEPRLYAPLAMLGALGSPAGRSNHVLVTLADHSAEAQDLAIAEFEESVLASDWQIAGALGTRMWERVIVAHLVDIGRLLAIIAGIALFIGAMGLASSISVGVVERYREIAVLKSIGGRSRAIVTIFASEALFLAMLGAGLAMAIAPWLSRAVADRFGTMMIEYPFDYRAAENIFPMALAVAAGIALIACVLPVRTALRMTIRTALRTE